MGFFDGNHTANAITGSVGKEGPAGVGFKLTDDGNYDMDKKKIFGLKTQDDVAFDADLDTYAKDLSSAVNKRYVNQFLMKKNSDETHFDCVGLSLQNTEAYYDGLYNDLSIPNVEYVKLEDNKVKTELNNKLTDKADLSTNNEQTFNSIINVPKFDSGYSNMSNVMNKEYIDSRDALKADKTYADNTFLTKKTGAILANTLQSKVSKIYADSTFLTKAVGNGLAKSIQNRLNIHGSNMMQANLHMNDNRITNLSKPIYGTDGVNKLYVDSSHITSIDKGNVFNNIMIDSDNQLSEENDIELGDLIHHPNPVHQINKKANVDIVVVFLHYGQERTLRALPYQHRINKHLMSLGVQIIIAAHPHVLQPHCIKGNKLIAYSLGNFLFYPNRPSGAGNPKVYGGLGMKSNKLLIESYEHFVLGNCDSLKASQMLKVTVSRNGIVEAKYLPVKIAFDRKTKRIHPEPQKNAKWITVCGAEDKQCQECHKSSKKIIFNND
ncbi:hypothetical protein ACROYT_G026145 [Oculina patagonica]